MRPAVAFLHVCAIVFLVGCGSDTEFVPLFNGEDLSGWKNVNGAPSTWRVEDGKIICSGIPTGVLCTERHYENYVLELEWRHMKEGGNAGLFVHSDPLPARGQPFTRSTECQIMDGNHGDVFAIHGATMVPDRPHPQGWMRSLPTEERANPTGEWNHYRVESRDGRLTLAVNGAVVSGGSDLNPRKGYICLESEGSEVHFRNIRIRELPSTDPAPGETAGEYQGFASLYNGVDLSGWQDGAGAPWHSDDWRLRLVGDGIGEDARAPTGSDTHLWTADAYGDFELIVDWRVACDATDDLRSGIFLRGSTDAELSIGCGHAVIRAEALVRAPADEERSSRGWSRLVARVQGDRLSVELDGIRIAEERLPQGVPDRGPIGLADHGAPVEFANIFVKELP